jgi:hypothetical protein
MGSTRETSSGTQTQTVTPQPTEEERQLNKLALERERFLDPQIRQTQSLGLDLVSKLLAGQALPGYLEGLPGGISESVIGSIVDTSLRDLNTQLAASGAGTFMESGASQAAGVRAASDVRNQAAQFNLQNLQQLLNLGVGGQAQVQQPILGYSSLLSSRLAGLRPTTSTGTYSGQQQTKYDFFTSPFTLGYMNMVSSNARASMGG